MKINKKNYELNNSYQQLSAAAKTWFADTEKKLKYVKRHWLIYAAICFLSPLILIFFVPHGEDSSIWFQRSGSIVIVFSLLAELRSIEYKSLVISHASSFLLCNKLIHYKYNSTANLINNLTLFLITFGTLIWGYGDILFKKYISKITILNII